MSPRDLDLRPIDLDPMRKGSKRLVDGPAKVGALIEGGGLDSPRVEVASDATVSFGSSQRVGEHFVRDAVQSVIEVLVTEAALAELGEDSKSPSIIHQPNEEMGSLGTIHIDHNAWVGDMRAALRAGRRPATAPMRTAAPNPPPQASTGTTTDHPLIEA